MTHAASAAPKRSAAIPEPLPLHESFVELFEPGNEGKCLAITWEVWRKRYCETIGELVRELPPRKGMEFAIWEDRFTGNVIIERKAPDKAYHFAGKEWMKRLV